VVCVCARARRCVTSTLSGTACWAAFGSRPTASTGPPPGAYSRDASSCPRVYRPDYRGLEGAECRASRCAAAVAAGGAGVPVPTRPRPHHASVDFNPFTPPHPSPQLVVAAGRRRGAQACSVRRPRRRRRLRRRKPHSRPTGSRRPRYPGPPPAAASMGYRPHRPPKIMPCTD
jgi:hypothetical protein